MSVAYRPNPAVLEQLKAVTLVAVVGPTGVGKTTLMNGAVRTHPDIHVVVGDTSRSPRPEEQEGVDYHFRTRQEMLDLMEQGVYVQVAPSVTGDLYASRPESYGTSGVAMLAVLADVVPLFRALPFLAVRSIFVVPPSFEVWRQRMNAHAFTTEQRVKRLTEAQRSFDFALHDDQLYFVINDEKERAQMRFDQCALGTTDETTVQEQYEARRLTSAIAEQLTKFTESTARFSAINTL